MGGRFDAGCPGSSDSGDARVVGDGSGSELDRVCTLLGDRWCRYVLYCLQELDDDVTSVDDLVEAIREWEAGGVSETPSRERVEIDLRHDLLPRLADHDVLEHDSRTDTIRASEDIFEREWFELLKEDELDAKR